MRLLPRSALLATPAALWLACATAAAQELVIQHIPQTNLTATGVPDLTMGANAGRWAAQAGFTVRWQAVPFKRSLEELRRNAEPFCVLGVFDVPERRGYARMSVALEPGEPQILIAARRVAAQMRRLPDARAALLDARFELLAFDGVAYGATLDRWIAARERAPQWINNGTAKWVSLLARGRADFTVSVPSEWRDLQAEEPEAKDLEVITLPGMPPPPTRHLACSQRVPPAWLARFDAAARAAPAR